MFHGIKAAVGGVAAQMAPPPPPPVWHTRLGQCDEQAPVNPDWLYSCFCTQCAAADAKSRVDKSHPLYNFCCWTPVGGYSFIRYAYSIEGVCGDDLCYGTFCMPCATRRMYTESKQRGSLNGPYGANSGNWSRSLFDCGPIQLCEVFCCSVCIAHEIRQKMQPRADSCWFDLFCVPPTAWYGQVRNTFGIAAEFGVAEDLCVPLFCFPCALIRAREEVNAQMQRVGGNLANTLLGPGGSASGGYTALR